MLRTFSEHEVRIVEALDGLWEFVTAAERKDGGRLPKTYPHRLHVPGCWEMAPGFEAYRGKAWYRRSVTSVEGLALRLVFGGVSHTGEVFVDGKSVGSHYDAYTPWDVVVTGLGTGPHEIVIEVDNSFGAHSALHLPNDYYTYGGLTRPVEVQLVPELFIEKLFAVPRRDGGNWALDLRVRLRNAGATAQRRRVVAEIAGVALDMGSATVPAGGRREVRAVVPGLSVEEWSAETPVLYDLDVTLFERERVCDDLVDRVGFRDVKVAGPRLLLNGREFKLRGYNRHEDHPSFGCSLPLQMMVNDMAIMRDLGCNFVRTSHYPNDMRFLDLCDELGFYVWEESHARQVKFDHPKYREQIAGSTVEMVEWHFNRPSIVIWGCLNECDSASPAGRAEHAMVLRQLKKMDSSRPVTYASHKRRQDICEGLCDIVAWNFYVGWYGQKPEETKDFLDGMLKWKNSAASRGGKGKPVIISEFGAGAIPGYRHPRQCHWTEEYQARVLDENLKVYLNHPAVSGAAIWQFCDVRITEEGEMWKGRPRTMNNKGTVDEYRRPKMAYEVVKKRMHAARRRFGR
ncbi:MAG: beta-glucuronidase [Lentisphaerae bacterium]|nr:beta-glucuronidase [Lentisphaerota bacterium]